MRNLIVLPDGSEIFSGPSTTVAIKNTSITELFNDKEDLSVGSACADILEVSLLAPDGVNVTAGDEITLYKISGETRTKKGVFIVDKPTQSSAYTVKLTAYDRVIKLDKDLTEWLNSLAGWPYKLIDFARMVCEICGVTLVTESVPNGDFLINKFVKNGVTGRKLMRWIGEVCCRITKANADGNIELTWYSPSGVTLAPTGENYYFQGSFSQEKYAIAPIEAVRLRFSSSEAGYLWPEAEEGANSYVISENPFLASTTDEVASALNTILAELSGVIYTPCKVSVPSSCSIKVGQTVQIMGKDGKTITAYVMKATTKGQRMTLECTGNQRRDSTGAMNNKTQSELAQEAVANQTHEDIFNKLTKNGAIQGIYVQDGKWYVNAELAKIINLIAEHVKSVKGDETEQTVEIDGGSLAMYVAGALLASLGTDPIFGGALLEFFHRSAEGKEKTSAYMTGSGFGVESNEEEFGITNLVQVGIDPETGVPYADFPRINDMRVWWEDNGDGTFTMKGAEV